MPQTVTPPFLARSSGPTGSSSGSRGDRTREILEEIKTLISEDYPGARRLASEAAARFPGHTGIGSAHRVLNSPLGPVGTAPPEPPTYEEFDWLSHPPEAFRGQWVALAGKELVASAAELVALMKILRSQHPKRRVLVHHLELARRSPPRLPHRPDQHR